MKKPAISPSNPLLARANGIPLAVHFHAWLLKRGIFYTMASAYVRAALALAEHFKANPADITARAVLNFAKEQKCSTTETNIYVDAHSLWKEYWARREKAVPDDWATTTGVIADVLDWKSRIVVKALKYYALDHGKSLEDFEEKFGPKWRAYVVPVGFFRYAEKVKMEDDARWKSPPKEVAGV